MQKEKGQKQKRLQNNTAQAPAVRARTIGPEGLGVFWIRVPVAMLPRKARRPPLLHAPAAAAAAAAQLVLLLLLAQQPHHVVKGLLDVDAVLGRRLDKLAAQLFRQRRAFLRGHGALHGLVALVADQHDGRGPQRHGGARGERRVEVAGAARGRARVGRLLDALDLVVELVDAAEGRARRDAVHQHEALAVADPLVAQRGVFLLAGGVEHLEHARLLVDDDLFAVRVFDGGVVGLDEVVQAELLDQLVLLIPYASKLGRYLDGQRRLAHAAVAQHHQLIHGHFAGHDD
jgi:hypothetical protein